MLDLTDLRDRAGDQVATLSGGNRQRVNIAIGLLAEPDVLLLDEPSAALDPRQRERLWEFILALAGEGTTVLYSTHNVQEAERYADQLLVLADGERLFDGLAARARAGGRARRGARLRGGLRGVPAPARPLTRALAAAQGPADPAALAAAGRAARALPDRDRRADRLRALARARQAARSRSTTALPRASRRRSSSAATASTSRRRASALFDAIDPVRVNSQRGGDPEGQGRRRARRADHPDGPRARSIQSRLEPGTVEVYYNAEDPAKRQFVENTIKAQVQTPTRALTKRVAKEALQLLA